MPCYDPPLRGDEIERLRDGYAKRGEWDSWYDLTPKRVIEQWLCDALRALHTEANWQDPIHEDCLRWWEIHKRREKRP
jgi:hypothetical protein